MSPRRARATTHLAKTFSHFLPGQRRLSTIIAGSNNLNDRLTVDCFFSKALKVSVKMGFLRDGKQVHARLMKLGLYKMLSLQNQILNVYVKSKEFRDAYRLFDEMTVRNVVTWNTVICGLVNYGRDYEASLHIGFSYFKRMLLDKVGLDTITLNGLLRASLELNDVEIGKQVHCLIVKLGFELSCFVNSALVDLYGKCGLVEEARRIFDRVLSRDLVLWNVMISCYALNLLGEEAFRVFNLMQQENLIGDSFTFSSMLNSCATLRSCELGRLIHGLIIKLSFDIDILVASGVVDMYAKSENIGDARNAFDGMTAKSVVSWNTVVVAYGQHGNGKEAMKFLQAMLREFFAPDELTLASVLSSCGSTSNCCQIMQIHAHIVKIDFQSFLSVGNAMINAYSKCGRIASALKCFNSIPEPNLVTWTSIICAYAFNSPPKDSIEMFEKMLSAGVRPDKIAFLGVLSACSHAGLIKEGLHYFRLMVKHYHFFPDSEHYGCLIDLFGRAGLLDEAFNVLTTIPIEYRSDTLGAFIGACKIHKDVISAKWAMEKLLELKPHVPVNYALMSNMYANEGQWHDVAKVRKLMRDRCDHKVPGFSWMELGGDIHMFVSSDKCHPQGLEVYCMLGRLFGLMRDENTISKLHAMQENLLDECAL